MAKIANAIRARGEPVELIGRRVRALVSLSQAPFDAQRGRVALATWRFRFAKEDTPCDSQGKTLVKSGDQIKARGNTLRITYVEDRGEDLSVTAE